MSALPGLLSRPSRRARRPLAGVALAGVLALSGCGTDEATPSAEASGTPSPSEVATAVPPSEPTPAVTPDDAVAVSLTVAGGQVTGDVGRVEVPVGSRVRLSITSDVQDQVHVHGYDLYVDLSPGQSGQLEMVADQPGVFEVELHDARQVLTRLQVS